MSNDPMSNDSHTETEESNQETEEEKEDCNAIIQSSEESETVDNDAVTFKNKEDVKLAKKILQTAVEFRSMRHKHLLNKFMASISVFDKLKTKIMPDLYTHFINSIGCKSYDSISIINTDKEVINQRFMVLISGICLKLQKINETQMLNPMVNSRKNDPQPSSFVKKAKDKKSIFQSNKQKSIFQSKEVLQNENTDNVENIVSAISKSNIDPETSDFTSYNIENTKPKFDRAQTSLFNKGSGPSSIQKTDNLKINVAKTSNITPKMNLETNLNAIEEENDELEIVRGNSRRQIELKQNVISENEAKFHKANTLVTVTGNTHTFVSSSLKKDKSNKKVKLGVALDESGTEQILNPANINKEIDRIAGDEKNKHRTSKVLDNIKSQVKFKQSVNLKTGGNQLGLISRNYDRTKEIKDWNEIILSSIEKVKKTEKKNVGKLRAMLDNEYKNYKQQFVNPGILLDYTDDEEDNEIFISFDSCFFISTSRKQYEMTVQISNDEHLMDKIAFFQSFSFFENWATKTILNLMFISETKSVIYGHNIFREGDPTEYIYFLFKGNVDQSTTITNGKLPFNKDTSCTNHLSVLTNMTHKYGKKIDKFYDKINKLNINRQHKKQRLTYAKITERCIFGDEEILENCDCRKSLAIVSSQEATYLQLKKINFQSILKENGVKNNFLAYCEENIERRRNILCSDYQMTIQRKELNNSVDVEALEQINEENNNENLRKRIQEKAEQKKNDFIKENRELYNINHASNLQPSQVSYYEEKNSNPSVHNMDQNASYEVNSSKMINHSCLDETTITERSNFTKKQNNIGQSNKKGNYAHGGQFAQGGQFVKGQVVQGNQSGHGGQYLQSVNIGQGNQSAQGGYIQQKNQFTANGQIVQGGHNLQESQVVKGGNILQGTNIAQGIQFAQGNQFSSGGNVTRGGPTAQGNQFSSSGHLARGSPVSQGNQFTNGNKVLQGNQLAKGGHFPQGSQSVQSNPYTKRGLSSKSRYATDEINQSVSFNVPPLTTGRPDSISYSKQNNSALPSIKRKRLNKSYNNAVNMSADYAVMNNSFETSVSSNVRQPTRSVVVKNAERNGDFILNPNGRNIYATTHKSIAMRNLNKLLDNVKEGKNTEFSVLLDQTKDGYFDLSHDIGLDILETKKYEKQARKEMFTKKNIIKTKKNLDVKLSKEHKQMTIVNKLENINSFWQKRSSKNKTKIRSKKGVDTELKNMNSDELITKNKLSFFDTYGDYRALDMEDDENKSIPESARKTNVSIQSKKVGNTRNSQKTETNVNNSKQQTDSNQIEIKVTTEKNTSKDLQENSKNQIEIKITDEHSNTRDLQENKINE